MSRFIDRTGQRFGRLVVLELGEKNERGHCFKWVCQCDCGNVKSIDSTGLQGGTARSCGCLRVESKLKVRTTHGHARRGSLGKTSRTYNSWAAMRARCYQSSAISFPNYGGRGITVCDRWKDSFENFLADMGERPPGRSLERKKNSGHYEPGNCIWATRKEQNNNSRRNRILEWNGRSQTMSMWAEELGMQATTLWARLATQKWSVEKALTYPVRGAHA